jgi:hypothetical protein
MRSNSSSLHIFSTKHNGNTYTEHLWFFLILWVDPYSNILGHMNPINILICTWSMIKHSNWVILTWIQIFLNYDKHRDQSAITDELWQVLYKRFWYRWPLPTKTMQPLYSCIYSVRYSVSYFTNFWLDFNIDQVISTKISQVHTLLLIYKILIKSNLILF